MQSGASGADRATAARSPWDQVPGESSRAFAAFLAYLRLGPERSIDRAFAYVARDQSGLKRAPRRWRTWSSEWRWVARAEVWDAHAAKIEAQAREDAARTKAAEWADRLERLRQEEWDLAQHLLARLRQMLQFPLVRQRKESPDGVVVIEPVGWAMRDAARLALAYSKMARLATGLDGMVAQPGVVTTSATSEVQPDYSVVPAEDLERIEAIYAEINTILFRHGAIKRLPEGL